MGIAGAAVATAGTEVVLLVLCGVTILRHLSRTAPRMQNIPNAEWGTRNAELPNPDANPQSAFDIPHSEAEPIPHSIEVTP
jgi:hypothetical protein